LLNVSADTLRLWEERYGFPATSRTPEGRDEYDRDQMIDMLAAALGQGRLTRDEFDLRLGQALGSRYFGDLMTLIADLPVGPFQRLPAHPVAPRLRR